LDTLSRLLTLYPVQAALDYRCHFGAPWRIEDAGAPAGVAPYHVVTEGSGWLDTAERKAIRLRAGDVVVLPHGSAHCLRTEGDAPALPAHPSSVQTQAVQLLVNEGTGPKAEILCGQFRFDPRVAGALFAALPALVHINAESTELADLQALIALLRSESAAERPGSATILSQLASVLFALLLRAWLEQASDVPGMFGLLADPRLRNALQAMLSEPGRAWSVNELAEVCHLSRATFARRFQKCAGTTPAEMLMRTRMAQAAQWLAQDSRSVGAIAEAVGYQSEAAFHRAFSRVFGVGPGHFRRAQS
jgi:AraC family transcriptional activator of mtrCDE